MKVIKYLSINQSKTTEDLRPMLREIVIELVDSEKKEKRNARLTSIMQEKISINKKKYSIKSIINKYTNFLDSYDPIDSERVYCFYHDIQEIVLCKNCQKVKVNYKSFTRGYSRYCSYTCSTLDVETQAKFKQTSLDNHGFEHPMKSPVIQEKTKQTNFKKTGFENPMQSSVTREKMRNTNMKQIGFEYPMQSPVIQEKTKQTNFKKTGFEYTFQSPETKEKSKKTSLKRYNTEHPMQSPVIQEKFKKTSLDNHGFEHPMKSPVIQEKQKQTVNQRNIEDPHRLEKIQEKTKQTNLKIYDVENTFQFEEFKEKAKQTNIKKIGFEYASQSPVIQEKIKRTSIDNHGFEHPMKSPAIQEKLSQSSRQNFYNSLSEKEWFKEYEPLFTLEEYKGVTNRYYTFKHRKCGHIFQGNIDNGQSPRCSKCYPPSTSKGEKEVAEF
ncbi:MAG: hypothetical protein U9N34_10900, partial [Candidatus Cloacimonadota bacterium]|nr:hypothetical protein [Candidatus Cloacimonadota bacterium]